MFTRFGCVINSGVNMKTLIAAVLLVVAAAGSAQAAGCTFLLQHAVCSYVSGQCGTTLTAVGQACSCTVTTSTETPKGPRLVFTKKYGHTACAFFPF